MVAQITKTTPKTFRSWLRQFKGKDSPYGDLATDAFDDSNWTGNTVKSLAIAMVMGHPCYEAWATFRDAARAYITSMGGTNRQKANIEEIIARCCPDDESNDSGVDLDDEMGEHWDYPGSPYEDYFDGDDEPAYD
ncbi:hypothetical protein [Nostoc parmelioides]|uniref:Uncharacterized protein n=1 Tax=Nostoc parmelioides FACHB-3921 TaxID=2692909 RepID=A0ABR8BBU3_9NOSO|nr:hypothetical protein [Nostoc parmelioides]MBD2250994.1 hypothetical protein [Nostoc parmelioides FACHB-3921]